MSKENYWLSEIQKGWLNLQYASYEIRNNNTIVMEAIDKSFGEALKYVSPELQNDKKIVTAAVSRDYVGNTFQFAHPELQKDKDFIMELMQTTTKTKVLQYVQPEIRNDKAFIMQVVQRTRWALKDVPSQFQNDKEVVMTAIKNSDDESECSVFQYASPSIRNDKEVALAAISKNPDLIKYVGDHIKRDPDILIAAGMFDKDHDVERSNVKKIAFSTRFSLTPSSHSQATKFTTLLKQHEYIKTGNHFKIYAPNAFDKQTCDPEWTRFGHPCRGTKETCLFDDSLKTGHPTDRSCWRYSFRSQLQEAKDTSGFMLQLIESDKWKVGETQKLGNGQRIELDMANSIGTKTFQVYRPTNDTMNDAEKYEMPFTKKHIDIVVEEISKWYSNDCHDMSVTVIRLSE